MGRRRRGEVMFPPQIRGNRNPQRRRPHHPHRRINQLDRRESTPLPNIRNSAPSYLRQQDSCLLRRVPLLDQCTHRQGYILLPPPQQHPLLKQSEDQSSSGITTRRYCGYWLLKRNYFLPQPAQRPNRLFSEAEAGSKCYGLQS